MIAAIFGASGRPLQPQPDVNLVPVIQKNPQVFSRSATAAPVLLVDLQNLEALIGAELQQTAKPSDAGTPSDQAPTESDSIQKPNRVFQLHPLRRRVRDHFNTELTPHDT